AGRARERRPSPKAWPSPRRRSSPPAGGPRAPTSCPPSTRSSWPSGGSSHWAERPAGPPREVHPLPCYSPPALHDSPEVSVARSIGPYTILEALGSGARGEVFLAEDTRLGRRVAIKTLAAAGRRELAEARRWVLREARAAARLNHPHIAGIY